ncbi:thioredoxin family protein [Uliginosibacterium sp. H3]|uniref:Thioredoxin family protein n=1 Tax=Uliginosibacterium silvisoli TaxID=3114758 RepID=A0ABU6JY76_9RHOO|nr:thioredoxin family protein [Uliginosibacterium sp. H3]
MSADIPYAEVAPTRDEIDAMTGPVVVDFGTNWCGFCRAAQPLIGQAFDGYAGVRHIKVEDGQGRRLGRSFSVKLWPTLVFMRDGKEVSRLVRPGSVDEIARQLATIDAPGV